jgi:beta-galactosidase
VGSAYPDWLHDFHLALLAGMNARMTRWLHIMPSPQDIAACDRQGVPQMMIGADREADVQGREWEIRSEIMRDVIIYNRNHPSIVFWEGANNTLSTEHRRDLLAHRDRYDNRGYRRLLGGRSGGEWSGAMFFCQGGMATEYMRDESPRRWWDAWSPPFLHKDKENYKENGDWDRNQDNMCRTQANVYEKYFKARENILGGVQIFFADCNTPLKRGIDEFRRSGAVDAMRIRKDAYYCNQTMWSNTPELWTEGKPSVFLPAIGTTRKAPSNPSTFSSVRASRRWNCSSMARPFLACNAPTPSSSVFPIWRSNRAVSKSGPSTLRASRLPYPDMRPAVSRPHSA